MTPTLNGRLLELVRRLDQLGSSPTLVDLAQAMKTVNLTAADVARFVQTDQRAYHRAPVVVREGYELLVMTWLPGQASVPHDHSGSICAMHVVQGEAVEGCYEIAPDGYVRLQYETTAHTGEVMAGQDAGVHTVRNGSQTGELLVTVHIYAPPLKDFRRFSLRPGAIATSPRAFSERAATVLVVGGGFSGSMAAAQILRRARDTGAAVKVVLVERRGAIGEGVAYGTRETCHLLNVPAGRMSAWPDRPDDFVHWATRRHRNVDPSEFLPRPWYGEYVRETLLTTAHGASSSAELTVVLDEVRRIARHPAGGWMVHLGREPSVRADAVVLAIGHRPPHDPVGLRWSGPRTRYISDPWRPFAVNPVGPDDPVLILGSGLTGVDTVLSLAEQTRRAPITLLSRSGLVPQAHAAPPAPPVALHSLVARWIAAPGGVQAAMLLRELRRQIRALGPKQGDWRSVVDGLRPHTAALWQAMPASERRRFLARLRPFWEVHRHRMALPIAERFHAMLDRGEVNLLAGRIQSAHADSDGVRLLVRERKSNRVVESNAAWVINCTGPLPSNRVDSNPVIGSLLVYGWLRPDELALGIETTPAGNAVAEDGREVADLFVVGTLRKPAFWESTAVPELRHQAAAVAENVLALVARHRQDTAQPVSEATRAAG
jgi:uncharacterized NAD(P)/FAD-binding protein YdhS